MPHTNAPLVLEITKYIYSKAINTYFKNNFMLFYTSHPLQFRGKYLTLYIGLVIVVSIRVALN